MASNTFDSVWQWVVMIELSAMWIKKLWIVLNMKQISIAMWTFLQEPLKTLNAINMIEETFTRSIYQEQGQVITSHR